MNRGDTIPYNSMRKARQVLVPIPAEMAVKAALEPSSTDTEVVEEVTNQLRCNVLPFPGARRKTS